MTKLPTYILYARYLIHCCLLLNSKWIGFWPHAQNEHDRTLGIQIRNMKMFFNIYGTWHWVTFEKLMMKNYDFFFIWLSRFVTPYNIV